MNCSGAKELFSEYIDGALDDATVTSLEDHLRECGDCSAEVDDLRAFRLALGSLPRVAAPPNFLKSVHERIERKSPFRRLASRLFFPLRVKVPLEFAGLAAAALLVVALYLPSRLPMEIRPPADKQAVSHRPAPVEPQVAPGAGGDVPAGVVGSSKEPEAIFQAVPAAPEPQPASPRQIETAPPSGGEPLLKARPDAGMAALAGKAAAPMETRKPGKAAGKETERAKVVLKEGKPIEIVMLIPLGAKESRERAAARTDAGKGGGDLEKAEAEGKKEAGGGVVFRSGEPSGTVNLGAAPEPKPTGPPPAPAGRSISRAPSAELYSDSADKRDSSVKKAAPIPYDVVAKVRAAVGRANGAVLKVDYDELTNRPRFLDARVPARNYGALLNALRDIGEVRGPDKSALQAEGDKTIRLRLVFSPSDRQAR